MKTLELVQGSPEWLAHRATHWNASDAPAMLGCSSHTTRTQLLQQIKTGITPEVDPATQRRYDDGHRFEALARPLAEMIVGENLYPVVGTEGKYSASFDGLTMAEDTGFEHKSLNSQLKAALMSDAGADALPKAYRVQMEQQLMVSGAERVLFMASKWDGETLVEELHDWYEPDAELRAEIIAGWTQFEQDLASFEPQAAAIEKIAAEPVEALPTPVVQVSGTLTLKDNFKVFETAVRDFIEHRLIREPKTDQDFADLEVQIKAMKGARESLKSGKAQMWAQVQPVDQANKTADMLDALLQQNCSMAERLLKGEKEQRRGEIVAGGVSKLKAHIETLNARLGKPYMPAVPVDFGGAVKGLKSLASMEDKVDTELTRAKIAASAIADRIDTNLKHLSAEAGDFLALFPDVATVSQKDPQDFAALVQVRVADQRAKDEKRAEAQRERIAAEERSKAEAAVRAEQAAKRRAEEAEELATRQKIIEQERSAQAAIAEARASESMPAPLLDDLSALAADLRADTVSSIDAKHAIAAAKDSASGPPTLTLGQIGTRLGFALPAAFIETLGFAPTRARGAVLFHEEQFPAICEALVAHIHAALEAQTA